MTTSNLLKQMEDKAVARRIVMAEKADNQETAQLLYMDIADTLLGAGEGEKNNPHYVRMVELINAGKRTDLAICLIVKPMLEAQAVNIKTIRMVQRLVIKELV